MGKRKSLKNEATDYIISTAGCAITFYSASAAIAYYGDGYFDLVWPALAAVSAPVITRLLNARSKPRLAFAFGHTIDFQQPRINRPGRFESLVKWSSGGYSTADEPDDLTSYKIKYDDAPPVRYYWDVQLTNRYEPVRIFEDYLFDFVTAASRRQRNGERSPLSRTFFTQRYRPPFSEPEYNALVKVLEVSGLVYNRGQGASGRLAYPRQVSFSVEYAKRYFSTLSI